MCVRESFFLDLSHILQCFKNKNGGVGPKTFIVWLLTWPYLRLSRNIFSGSLCISVYETKQRMCMRGSFSLNLSENENFIVQLLKWSCLRLSRNIFFGSRCIHTSETSHRRCLRGSFCWFRVKIPQFFKYKNGGVGDKNFSV